jgi:tripeptidyl-peptidase-1
MDMSTPSHKAYGHHFQSYEDMKTMLRPSEAAVDGVVDWLRSAGVADVEEDADWVNFRTTVGVANQLLHTKFQWYSHEERHIRRLRTLEYSIPDNVTDRVYMIQPTTRFGQIRSSHAQSHRKQLHGLAHQALQASGLKWAGNSTLNGTDVCKYMVTPACLKQLYHVNYRADAHSGSRIAFASFLEQYARYQDLAAFEKQFAPGAVGQNFSVVQIHGGKNGQKSSNDSSEANLDLQYILGLSHPLPVTEYSTGGQGPLVPDINEPDAATSENEPYLDFLQAVLKSKQKDLPQVISTSYGEDEQSIPPKYARTVCNLYAQLGSRGVSVIFASGDSGVGTGCVSNDGRNATRFLPQFPATCPFVTAVGATQFQNETAASFSAGGFSDLWPRPSYQDQAIQTYLGRLGEQWKGLFNPGGRAFPDVSAAGFNYAVMDKGLPSPVEGTSAAAPTFAALIALLNDARLRASRPVLGFLNPWLYAEGYKALNDITTGGSTGCDGRSRFGGPVLPGGAVVPGASWKAVKGWDPVTGFGTPDFAKMLKMVV